MSSALWHLHRLHRMLKTVNSLWISHTAVGHVTTRDTVTLTLTLDHCNGIGLNKKTPVGAGVFSQQYEATILSTSQRPLFT